MFKQLFAPKVQPVAVPGKPKRLRKPSNRKVVPPDHPYRIGSAYFIRTVTVFHVGRLVQVTDHELVLEDASWVRDTGPFTDSLRNAEFASVEPFPDGQVIVNRGCVIDAVRFSGVLPRIAK